MTADLFADLRFGGLSVKRKQEHTTTDNSRVFQRLTRDLYTSCSFSPAHGGENKCTRDPYKRKRRRKRGRVLYER